ncbi:uncharacterized protein BXZ73DRAFT_98808 [Epithele typhae]|uniref:uncharacterized protein n=1 Tax=Epithele typhae TaxID=378194 RepID=UPI0020080DB7|nr:uncharacterized protein BXZ73DRAFT_98808 [Epithele typhae]KAH9940366.1 hypothetical protein BXZ73DRAFT_98808 [Epithele typhae]
MSSPDPPPLVADDPPPPYPTTSRRTRHNRRRPLPQSDSPSSHPPLLDPHCHHPPPDHQPTESTPLLSPHDSGPVPRRRTLSLTSTLRSSSSITPSFAHSVFSAFRPERDSDFDSDGPDPDAPPGPDYDSPQRAFVAQLSAYTHLHSHPTPPLPFPARCRRYFRPLSKPVYYASLLHLALINFPYALLAWVFLFVFTLVGTCTLVALPLGAVVCFVDLFGARVLARGELFLQTKFHAPISYPLPPTPLPIFTRSRLPTPAQVEAGTPSNELVHEPSFYRNAYAMFTDPTSYQALFYFLVLKPGVTVLMFLFFAIVTPVAAVLIVPLPAVLRLARRMGVWQANVAIEGLYFAA